MLATGGVLDRETTSFYNLTVEAQNGDEYNYTQVFINVTDANDNAPVVVPG